MSVGATGEGSRGAPRVLVVDDVEAIRALVRAALEPAFEVVGEAGDGAEAVQRARELQPSLVLLDLNMPRHDGLEAIRDIRRDAPNATICVLTGLAEELVAAKAYELGAHGFVEKSSPLHKLPAILWDLLGRRAADEEAV
jgi:CheY-like chemotaxis protein